MLNVVHVTAAAAIVAVVPTPLALPMALASHIVLDTVPHWNWSPGRTFAGKVASVGDLVAAAGVTWWLMGYVETPWLLAGAAFLSTVPDLIQGPYHMLGYRPRWLSAFVKWESRRQKWPWMKPWMGIATQIITVAVSLFIFFGN